MEVGEVNWRVGEGVMDKEGESATCMARAVFAKDCVVGEGFEAGGGREFGFLEAGYCYIVLV